MNLLHLQLTLQEIHSVNRATFISALLCLVHTIISIGNYFSFNQPHNNCS